LLRDFKENSQQSHKTYTIYRMAAALNIKPSAGLPPGSGVFVDPARLGGTSEEQDKPYFMETRGVRVYESSPESVLKAIGKFMKASSLPINKKRQKQSTAFFGPGAKGSALKRRLTRKGSVAGSGTLSKAKAALSSAGSMARKAGSALGTWVGKAASATRKFAGKAANVTGRAASATGRTLYAAGTKAASATRKFAGKAANVTGRAASATGRTLYAAGTVAANKAGKAARATGRGLSTAASATGRGLSAAASATGRGLSAAASATGRGLSTASASVKRFLSSLSKKQKEVNELKAAAAADPSVAPQLLKATKELRVAEKDALAAGATVGDLTKIESAQKSVMEAKLEGAPNSVINARMKAANALLKGGSRRQTRRRR